MYTSLVLSAVLVCFLQSFAEPVRHGPGHRRTIALTFDACQTWKPAGYDAKIVQILIQTKTKATLFLGGAWAETHAAEARLLGHDPLFEIATHSYLHHHFPKLAPSKMTADLSRAQNAIKKATGRTPSLFRPPYGEWNTATMAAAKALGLQTVLWSVVTGDPDKHITAKAIVKTVLAQAKPGAIVIMHMNGRGWHTAEALPNLIKSLRSKGYTFETVSEILKD